jgi:hypothetical protein
MKLKQLLKKITFEILFKLTTFEKLKYIFSGTSHFQSTYPISVEYLNVIL